MREVRGSGNSQVRDQQDGLGEEHSVVQDRMFVRRVAIRPPLAPGVSVVAQLGAGNQAQRAVDPAARRGIDPIIVEKI